MSWIKNILLGLLGLVIIIIVSIFFFLRSKSPQYEGEVNIPCLEKEVNITFDKYGIPHISASNSEDAYRALGYVQASERLFQMEMLRRVTKGELSEILGEDLLPVDQLFLTLGIKDHSKKSAEKYHREKPNSYKQTIAFIEGINAYIAKGKKPIEFDLIGIELEPFIVEDCFAISGYMSFSFAAAMKTDPHLTYIMNKFGQEYLDVFTINWTPGQNEIPVLQDSIIQILHSSIESIGQITERIPLGLFHGSNGVVLSGKRTKSGVPCLINDTHIGYGQPSIWYEAHMEYPGQKVYGNYLAGFPFALIGHTQHHSWGITMLEADDMDFYIEKTKPEDAELYWKDSVWLKMESIHHLIKVKGRDTLTNYSVRKTTHGPIVNKVFKEIATVSSDPISVKWVYTDFLARSMEGTYENIVAKNIEEFSNACSKIHSPPLSIMYADVEGNIAWWAVSKLPLRPKGMEPKLFIDGSNSKNDYLGYLPFDQNPYDINPESGIIITSNNQPDTTIGGFYLQGYYVPADRFIRLQEILAKKEKWAPVELKKVMLDHINPVHRDLTQYLLGFLEKDQQPSEVLNLLSSWDGSHELNALAPSIYYRWIYHIETMACADELGPLLYSSWIKNHIHKRSYDKFLRHDANPWWDDIRTKKKEVKKEIISLALQEAVSELEEAMGDNIQSWTWDRAHTITHKHALDKIPGLRTYFNVGPYTSFGGSESVMNQLMTNDSTTIHEIGGGPAIRRVIDMAHPDSSWNILPTGQSGHPASQHYRDQAPLFHKGEYRMQWMRCNDIPESTLLKLLPTK